VIELEEVDYCFFFGKVFDCGCVDLGLDMCDREVIVLVLFELFCYFGVEVWLLGMVSGLYVSCYEF